MDNKTEAVVDVAESKETQDSAKKTSSTKTAKKTQSTESKSTPKAKSATSDQDHKSEGEVKQADAPTIEPEKESAVNLSEDSTGTTSENQDNNSDETSVTQDKDTQSEDNTEQEKDIAQQDKPADDVSVAEHVGNEITNLDEGYPFVVNLSKALRTFRGPSTELFGKSFGGKVTVTGTTDNGFYEVSIVRSGLGLIKCYMLRKEVDRCRF